VGTQQRARGAVLLALGLALGIAGACAPAAAPAPAATAAPSRPPASPVAAAPAAAAATPAAARPDLATAPAVDLKVGVIPQASYAPFFVAQHRGYFQEVGLNVEFFPTGNILDQLPAIAQGQLQVGSCSTGIACFNAINRRTDIQIVGDLQSAGKTEKSTGNLALVARKDVWDSGAVRGPQDLFGRTIYTQAGVGSGPHLVASRWLLRAGIDPRDLDWTPMNYPEVFAAMQNQGIEVGFSTEPLVTAGIERGVHQILATQEEMYPTTSRLYLLYSSSIERLGPQVGERFMVAYLRGARDYVNAFEYGVNQDAIIDTLTQETPVKDAATYQKIKYSWVDPNGVVSRATLESDAQLFLDLGLLATPVDLSNVFVDKYREFAVRYLGEYQPPR
jgi:NitT/TauT family transport system substrate-binding protein